MLIYNVTIKVDNSIAARWLAWMKQQHIPDVLNTGCFTQAVVLRLLEVDDTEGPTYAIQYHTESKADYNRYIDKYSEEMRQKVFDKWGSNYIAFRSLMQVID
jgi:hypothetical protein